MILCLSAQAVEAGEAGVVAGTASHACPSQQAAAVATRRPLTDLGTHAQSDQHTLVGCAHLQRREASLSPFATSNWVNCSALP